MKKEKLLKGTETLSVDSWRKRFKALSAKLKNTSVKKALVAGDPYYNSVDGMNDYNNIVRGSAGLERTARAVHTLEKYLDGQSEPKPIPRHLRKMHIPKKEV